MTEEHEQITPFIPTTITVGWYWTRDGKKAYVAAICPEPANEYGGEAYASHAVGWVIRSDGLWVAYSWSALGRADHRHETAIDLVSRQTA